MIVDGDDVARPRLELFMELLKLVWSLREIEALPWIQANRARGQFEARPVGGMPTPWLKDRWRLKNRASRSRFHGTCKLVRQAQSKTAQAKGRR
jgi:hypothetical protein